MKIAVVGSGYLGLVVSACFAHSGTNVMCIEADEAKLAKLRAGDVPFFEPRLTDLLKHNRPHRLDFTSNMADGIRGREVVFIAVETPQEDEGSDELSYVLSIAEQVARAAEHDLALVLMSTVPVGTNERVRAVVRHAKHQISVVTNPEFLKEGNAVDDFFKPDRIVIGCDDDHAFDLLQRLYAPYHRQRGRIHRMSPKSAEIVKYASNAMLATKISFMNEIAALCDVTGADVEHVRLAVGSDERIGLQFLYPGLGFGGSRFPKDLRALVRTGEEHNLRLEVAGAAARANDLPVQVLLRHMERDLGGLGEKTIAVWGLAFKPETDDVREAPGIKLIAELVARGARVRATDPRARETARASLSRLGLMDRVELVESEYETCRGADALVLATEWNEYRNPEFSRVRELLRGRHVFDGRNMAVPASVEAAGLAYRCMGRPTLGY